MLYPLKRRIYEGLPGWLKAPVGWIPFAWLAGPGYRATLRRGDRFERATAEELRAYQERQLGEMLRHVCEQVPAYRDLRAEVGRLGPFEALRAFPLLDKEALQADMHRYLPRDFAAVPHYECTTGGTSGRQLRFYLDEGSQSVEMAFMHRQWRRVGYDPSCRKATFRGVDFRDLRDGVYWQANPVYNELQFSPYHMNPRTLGRYVDRLIEYRPRFLHGYPSALSILADYVVRNDISPAALGLRGVLLGSETLFPEQREMIARAFGARPFSWYGHSERLILAGECEQTAAYHHFPDYGILEILDASGRPVAEGEAGEIVGTGLLNRALPLIRYRTGDRARQLPCACACGRFFDRFDSVEGRWEQEFVIGKEGSRISVAALNIHGPWLDRVIRYQYRQDTPGKMEILVMSDGEFSAGDEAALRAAYAAKTGAELEVSVRVVDDIPLTARGKLKRLVQEIPPDRMP